jgi:DNA invertase Pin-like site-specific DNA recombinase
LQPSSTGYSGRPATPLVTAEAWHKRGISLILVDSGVEPVSDNGTGKLFLSILASVAEFERQRIADRMREGRTGKRQRDGHIGGQAPYGMAPAAVRRWVELANRQCRGLRAVCTARTFSLRKILPN